MARRDWSESENEAIVADYFAMLSEELAGRSYNKAARNRDLRADVSRSRAAIEFKHRNISAVLAALGETWISGYFPAFNYQAPLEEAVARRLATQAGVEASPKRGTLSGLEEAPAKWRGAGRPIQMTTPPTTRNAPPPPDLAKSLATARKFDVAARDERNRALGRAGEERALEHERATLRGVGRADLADRVRWVSEEDGDGAGYDIESFETDGAARLLEVKTTNGGWEWTPFHISRNELDVADARRASWVLFRVWDFRREPKAFELRPPLDQHVDLTATSFQASFH